MHDEQSFYPRPPVHSRSQLNATRLSLSSKTECVTPSRSIVKHWHSRSGLDIATGANSTDHGNVQKQPTKCTLSKTSSPTADLVRAASTEPYGLDIRSQT